MGRLILISLFFVAAGFQELKAQCVDSMFPKDPMINCGTLFDPVCACDGKTYRNPCSAKYHAGIYDGYWVNGVCDAFYFDILPIPTQGSLSFSIMFRETYNSGSILIYDIFGNLAFQQNMSSVPQKYELNLYLYHLRTGVYVMWVTSGNVGKFRKFVKVQ